MTAQVIAALGNRGRSTHQNAAHRILADAGYRFDRLDGQGHNHYRNEHDQEVIVAGTPRNSSEGINRIRNTIRRNQRDRQEAHVTIAQQSPALVDQLVAMADPLVLKPLGPNDHQKSQAARIKYQAFVGWLRRVYEKHAPLPALPLEQAVQRLGFTQSQLHRAKKDLGVKSVRMADGSGHVGSGFWVSCLAHQVPEGSVPYGGTRAPTLGVSVTKPEPEPEPEGRLVSHLEVTKAGEIKLREPAPEENGRPPMSEQQTAFLMMAESLGMKLPGQEAREALVKAGEALDDAHAALSAALEALGG
jgi:hypothetical protein